MLQNLATERRRAQPELIDLAENLSALGISQDQLIALAILIGTDYNPGGVHGLGPKKGLELVKRFGSNFEGLFQHTGWNYDVDWKEIFNLFKEMPVLEKYSLEWKPVNIEKLTTFLVDEHNFNLERVQKSLKELSSREGKKQTCLGEFL